MLSIVAWSQEAAHSSRAPVGLMHAKSKLVRPAFHLQGISATHISNVDFGIKEYTYSIKGLSDLGMRKWVQ